MTPTTHMPAEWEPHQAILLSWPHNPRTWPNRVEEVRAAYMHFIREISESEPVWLLVADAQTETEVRRRLRLACVSDAQVKFLHHRTQDSWIRDYGPIAVYDQNGKLALTDWIFNGWGDKYAHEESYETDNAVPSRIAAELGVQRLAQNLILEGGSIDVNGSGTILTSKSCLLNENRNSQFSQSQIVEIVSQVLGVRNWIWMPDGIAGDDTDGHIDDTVRFVSSSRVLCAFEENRNDENFAALSRCYTACKNAVTETGRPLEVVKLPMPSPLIVADERLPASYANFLICNSKVLVPTFACKQDEYALRIIQEQFPKRRVVGIDARDLVVGYGSLHCLSQQVPVLVREAKSA